ncbi:MAG: hypothetical protein R3F62_21110 [Planctomycetota bacterium]
MNRASPVATAIPTPPVREDPPTPVRDFFIARLLRKLRENPHGVQGPDVFRFVVTAFAKQERGWLPDGPEVVPRDVRLSWTKAILVFLAALSLDVEESEPQVSADAIWALAQVGFTREQVRAAHRRELLRLSRLVWRDAQPVVATEGGG